MTPDPSAEKGLPDWCAQVAQTIVPCPSTCKESAWHHHHNQRGTLWTNPGATCPSVRECERCEGSGLVWHPRPDDPSFDLAEDCPVCSGLGTRVTPPADRSET